MKTRQVGMRLSEDQYRKAQALAVGLGTSTTGVFVELLNRAEVVPVVRQGLDLKESAAPTSRAGGASF